ncbi:hypothetical protein C4J81_18095 [Deltaproteobacteria bacterium Smac51]|nr:hypothetical protein C4J81_18095 [Deltaproteobacteria bacterium Smac51]
MNIGYFTNLELLQMAMTKEILLNKEFGKFWQKIANRENFALLRYGDGEKALMTGVPVKAQEGWESPNYISNLGKALLSTLDMNAENVFHAISCPCCDPSAYYWFSTRISNRNKTFSNLFVNDNYSRFISSLRDLKSDAIFIGNHNGYGKKIEKLNILKYYSVGDDCCSFWEDGAHQLIDEIKGDFGSQSGLLYVLSAGPMSEPIIAELYKNNPDNIYIDFGSCLDEYIHNVKTRPYMKAGNTYASKNCQMPDPKITDFDVSVVLNLYKRPENLKLQVEALKNQTLKPKEILLYQDGTGDTVKIPEPLYREFDFIKVSPENIGVWGRFKFAEKHANCKYICVFDDDTIPGQRWLENCYSELLKQEGLYGTIGIITKEPESYPFSDFFRVGWDGQLNFTAEVDFVGHSWFFKKEWLRYLFESPEEIQKFKRAGEDMAFSAQLLKHGIKTFVPPHPKNNAQLYGSLPEFANALGRDSEGLSMRQANLRTMNDAIFILLKDGWKTISQRDPYLLYSIKKCLPKGKRRKNLFIKYLVSKIFHYDKTRTKRIITILGLNLKINRGKRKKASGINIEAYDKVLNFYKNYQDFRTDYACHKETGLPIELCRDIKHKLYKDRQLGMYYFEADADPQKYMFKYIKQSVQGLNDDSYVLEIGPGEKPVFQKNCYRNWYGADKNLCEDQIKFNGREWDTLKYPTSNIYQATWEDFCDVEPFKNMHGKFDLVVASHSFEHVIKPIKSLKNAAKMLTSGGSLVLFVPDGFSDEPAARLEMTHTLYLVPPMINEFFDYAGDFNKCIVKSFRPNYDYAIVAQKK